MHGLTPQRTAIIITDPTAITQTLFDFITGWFDDRDKIAKDRLLLNEATRQHPQLARAASTGIVGRANSVRLMHDHFFANNALEADGLLPGGTADAALFDQGQELGQVRAFSDAVLDVNLRDQENFEVPLGIGVMLLPLPIGKGRAVTEAASLWRSGVPGVQTRRFGNLWVKRVNPNSTRLMQWWGRQTINAQERGLTKLGDMATEHTMRNGVLFTQDVGATFKGGPFSLEMFNPTVRSAYVKGSWRMKNPFNDIIPRNMGINGKVFDPSIDWMTGSAFAGGTGLSIWGAVELGEELFDEKD